MDAFSSSGQRATIRMTTSDLLGKVKANVKPGSVVVIKYGGHAMENDALKELFLDDVASLYNLGITPVIVHGGGPQIAKMLKTLNIESKFVDGLRVTDEQTLEVAQMVLCGLINKDLVRRISQRPSMEGGAVGLCGLDSGLIKASVKDSRLGLVGEPTTVNAAFLKQFLDNRVIPVIAPIGTNEEVQTSGGSGSLNINADTAAGIVAQALRADIFLLLTDIVGVLNKDKTLIPRLPVDSIADLQSDGTISGGMIPKLETAASAVRAGVKAVAIMDGRAEHCVLHARSGETFGTVVY